MKLKIAEHLGLFTFQCQIFSNGDINFVYQSIPGNLTQMTRSNLHGQGDTMYGPMFVGISSQSLMSLGEYTNNFIEVDLGMIENGTSVIFKSKSQSMLESINSSSNYYEISLKVSKEQLDRLWQNPSNSEIMTCTIGALCGERIIPLKFEFPYFGYKVRNIKVFMEPELQVCFHEINAAACLSFGDFGHILQKKGKVVTDSTVTLYQIGGSIMIHWQNITILGSNSNKTIINLGITLDATGRITMLFKDSPYELKLHSSIRPYLNTIYHMEPSDLAEAKNHELFGNIITGMPDQNTIRESISTYTIKEEFKSDTTKIVSGSIVYFHPLLSTCLDLQSCEECVKSRKKIPCHWQNGQCANGNSSKWDIRVSV